VVEVREDRGRIVIERVTPRRYELSDLLKGITSRNQHQAIDFGPAVGGDLVMPRGYVPEAADI